MNDKQKEILNNLDKINDLLSKTYTILYQENKESRFDYCTNPGLANKIDTAERILKLMDKIVYQK